MGGFYYFLSKRFPYDLLELLSHSKKYTIAEEGIVVKKKENLNILKRIALFLFLDARDKVMKPNPITVLGAHILTMKSSHH